MNTHFSAENKIVQYWSGFKNESQTTMAYEEYEYILTKLRFHMENYINKCWKDLHQTNTYLCLCFMLDLIQKNIK